MTVDLLIAGGLVTALIAVSVIDARTGRIPDRLSLPLTGAGLALAAAGGPVPLTDAAVGAAAGYSALAAFGALWFRLTGREGLGLGDAKLVGSAGAWLGWAALPQVVLLAALGGLVFALLRRDLVSPLAFGPFIAASVAAFWLFARIGAI